MTIKSGKSRERVPQKGITLTYQQSSSEEATKAIENMKTYLSTLVKEKDHYLLFPNSIPSKLMVFSPGRGNLSPKYSHHSEKQLKRLQRLRSSAQSTAIVSKTSTTTPVNPPLKAPPSLK